MPVIYKADDTVEFAPLTKYDEERGELLNVVYAPEHRDSQGDIASATVIKDMAYDAARRGVDIDIQHDGKALSKDEAFLAENFLVAKGDERFLGWTDKAGNPANLTGAWATVIKLETEALRSAARNGQLGGVSMFGTAEMEQETIHKAPDEPSWFAKAMARITGKEPVTKTEDLDMDRKELEEVLAKSQEALVEKLAEALKPEGKTTELTVNKVELDLTDAKAVEAHLAKMRDEQGPDLSSVESIEAHLAKMKADELVKSVDFSDPKQVEAYLAKIKEGQPAEDPKVTELKAEIEKLEKASTPSKQVQKKDDDNEDDNFQFQLTKEEREDWALGMEVAKAINEVNGYSTTK